MTSAQPLLTMVKSQDVHKVLRPAIEGVLLPIGFSHTEKSPPEYRRPPPRGWCRSFGESKFLVISLQLDWKGGFNTSSGGKFTLNFELSTKPLVWTDEQWPTRFWRLLDRCQKQDAIDIERRVVAEIPPPPDRIANWFGGRLRTFHLPWEEVWMRYGTIGHVEMWAEYLSRNLASAIDRFESRSRIGGSRTAAT